MAEGDTYTPPATLTDLLEDTLLPMMLKYDISFDDFWNMTFKEINIYLKVIQEKEKSKYELAYLEASLIANFVGNLFGGKPIPSLYKVFPEFYIDENQKTQEEHDMKVAMLYKEQMLDWANAVNKRNKQKQAGDGENTKQ